MTRKREKSESGAALVEFALILPVFMILVLGVFSGAIVYNQKLDLAHAAREGARFGSVLNTTASLTGNCASSSWASCVQGITVERSGGDLTTGGVCVALVKDDGVTVYSDTNHAASWFSTNGSANCPNANDSAGKGTHVQVTAERNGKIEALVLKWNMTLKSNASARYEA
jgi:Flp pilus assembly protein TadG